MDCASFGATKRVDALSTSGQGRGSRAVIAGLTIALFSLFVGPPMNAQTPAPEGKEKPKAEEKKAEPKADEKKPEPKPVKPLESPCGGKLKAMHAYSQCGPDKVWHIVEDDYYDCPPVQKFRVYDHATEQPCDKPPPDPIKDGYQPFNGSGCQDYKDIGPMNIYECDEKTGFWYLNTYEVYLCDDGRRLVTLKDRKQTGKSCKDPQPELELPVIALNQPAPGKRQPNDSYAALVRDHKIRTDITGTGETIGHIADMRIQNLTDQPIKCVIPPVVLESVSGQNQDYTCPKGETVSVPPHDSVKVPLDGVCVNRHKPPVGKGVGGDLVVNDGRQPDEHSHLSARNADKLLRVCTSKYEAADKLQKDGRLKDLPYHDKEKQKEIVVQWSTWSDPRISEIIGGPPATKDDLKKVVYKQVEEKGPMTPETKKKVDQGIDTIFDKIELTTAKAKDLEKPDPFANVEVTGDQAKDTGETPQPRSTPENISDTRATPGDGIPDKDLIPGLRRLLRRERDAAERAEEAARDAKAKGAKNADELEKKARALREKAIDRENSLPKEEVAKVIDEEIKAHQDAAEKWKQDAAKEHETEDKWREKAGKNPSADDPYKKKADEAADAAKSLEQKAQQEQQKAQQKEAEKEKVLSGAQKHP